MISYRNRRILFQVIPFGIFSAVFSIAYSLIERGILGDHPVYPTTGNPYTPQFMVPAFISFLAGLAFGSLEVIYINKWFRKKSFLTKISFKSLIYFSSLVLVSLFTIIAINVIELELSILDPKVWEYVWAFISSFAFWSLILYFSIGIVSCLFFVEVSDFIGHEVLLNFFTGKYHQPIEEERMYMFLDMKVSTTIAEKLGHVRYFKLLRKYYIDLSTPILNHGGVVYQYVGNEVIVTWKIEKGAAKNALDCFFAMKQALIDQTENYQAEYGVVPTFKAGIHFGQLTTGEIGVIKKEITFSGDVLNTTARIQGLCNTYQTDLLVSGEFVNALEANDQYQPKALGEAELRGRKELIQLYTFVRTD